jgi:hypothetical protein
MLMTANGLGGPLLPDYAESQSIKPGVRVVSVTSGALRKSSPDSSRC